VRFAGFFFGCGPRAFPFRPRGQRASFRAGCFAACRPSLLAARAPLRLVAADDREQRSHAGVDVGAERDPECAPPARGERLVVAERLRRLERAEGELLAGDRRVLGGLGRELDEDAVRGAALVELARRVEEARAVADRRRGLEAIASAVRIARSSVSRSGVRST
jgi:hypothetical protein